MHESQLHEIRDVLARAGRRFMVIRFFQALVVCLFAALIALVLVRGGQKIWLGAMPWTWLFVGAAGGAVVVAALWALFRRRSDLDVARVVDERAGLNESLSTALCVGGQGDGWSRNVVDDAQAKAKRVVMRDTVPIQGPGKWPLVLGGLALLLAVWWVPAIPNPEREAEDARRVELEDARLEAKTAEDQVKALLDQVGVSMPEEGLGGEPGKELDPNAEMSPDDVRRSAIKKLTSVADELEKLTEGDKAAETKALEDAMRRMRSPGPGPMSEMGRAMADGDFGAAKKALDQIAAKMGEGGLSPEDVAKAKEQLDKLKGDLEKLAQTKKAMEDQLRDAGYSADEAKQLAENPDQLAEALKDNPNLTEGQKDALQQAAQAQQQASDAMNAMAQAMGQMAAGMQQNGMSPDAQAAADSLSSQLGDMEAAASELAGAQAAMSEVQRQLAKMGSGLCEGGQCAGFGEGSQAGKTGQFGQGERYTQGSGSGGPGRGNGQSPEDAPADYTFEKTKPNVVTGDGPVIASTLVYGKQIRGESKAAFGEAASSAGAAAAEAIETRRVPKEHEDAVRHYFGRLERVAGRSDAPDEGGTDE